MTEDIENITKNTQVAYTQRGPLYVRNLDPTIQDKILKNQERVTDLEKRISRFVAFVDEKDRISPEDDILTEIVNYINNVFGDFEAEK